jgi:hypothetical protein
MRAHCVRPGDYHSAADRHSGRGCAIVMIAYQMLRFALQALSVFLGSIGISAVYVSFYNSAAAVNAILMLSVASVIFLVVRKSE